MYVRLVATPTPPRRVIIGHCIVHAASTTRTARTARPSPALARPRRPPATSRPAFSAVPVSSTAASAASSALEGVDRPATTPSHPRRLSRRGDEYRVVVPAVRSVPIPIPIPIPLTATAAAPRPAVAGTAVAGPTAIPRATNVRPPSGFDLPVAAAAARGVPPPNGVATATAGRSSRPLRLVFLLLVLLVLLLRAPASIGGGRGVALAEGREHAQTVMLLQSCGNALSVVCRNARVSPR